jgi:hypothetical protein
VHAGDRLHHAPVAHVEADAVHVLHAPDVGGPVARDRDLGIAAQHAGHARDPEQLVAEVAVDELVDVAEVLRQLPGLGEGRRDELDQRLGIVGGDVRVRQRRAKRRRVRCLRNAPGGRHAQRLALDALAPAREDAALAGVDQACEPAFELAVQAARGHRSRHSAARRKLKELRLGLRAAGGVDSMT